jgi:hypothetical protein
MKRLIPQEVFGVTAHPISGYTLGDGFLDPAVVEMAASGRPGAPSAKRLHQQAVSISHWSTRLD